MLRTTANTFARASSWRNPALYSSFKCYSTPTPVPEAEKPSLSVRLGGSGRGKITDSADPFASFLNNARKNNNNRNRNGNFSPRNRKQPVENKGQFEDAAEPKKVQLRNNRKEKQLANSTDETKTTTITTNNRNNNNNNNNRHQNLDRNKRDNKQQNKRLNLRRSQPQEVRTRRATTFIDKDIDWASFDTAAVIESESVEETADNDNELVLKDIQGDYDRYLGVGADIKWADIVKGDTVSNLVGSNPTLDLQQKVAFLNAVSKATSGAAAVRK